MRTRCRFLPMGQIYSEWPGRLIAAALRRVVATRRVWERGGAHVAMLGMDSGGRASPRPRVRLPSAAIDRPYACSEVACGVVTISGWAATSVGPCSRVEL